MLLKEWGIVLKAEWCIWSKKDITLSIGLPKTKLWNFLDPWNFERKKMVYFDIRWQNPKKKTLTGSHPLNLSSLFSWCKHGVSSTVRLHSYTDQKYYEHSTDFCICTTLYLSLQFTKNNISFLLDVNLYVTLLGHTFIEVARLPADKSKPAELLNLDAYTELV